MKALILVGGYGTRLRPFTFTLPKPLVPFANKPIVFHQMEALIKVGVKEIILAVNVKPDDLVREVDKFAAEHKITVHYSKEDTPLGTAGPLALARELLQTQPSADGGRVPSSAPFFMLNSDVICDFPLEAMLNFHTRAGAEGTILSTEVKDPSKYGVIVPQAEGPIDQFVEKPTGVSPSNRINAGIYLLNTGVLDFVPSNTPMSIEREVFPRMLAPKKTLFSMHLPGYWMDIGQPKDYLTGTGLHLASMEKHSPLLLMAPTPRVAASASVPHGAESSGSPVTSPASTPASPAGAAESKEDRKRHSHKVRIIDNVLKDSSAVIGENSEIGPDVIIGAGCVVGRGVRLQRTTLMDGVRIGDGAFIKDSIIGWQSTIGDWARVEGSSLGQDVTVGREVFMNQAIVLPHKGVSASLLTPGQIVM